MHFNHHRRGLSLMEVILAIAILGGSLTAIGQLIRIGARNAAAARDLTMAQVLAETQVARITAGVELPEPATDEPWDPADGEWLYSVDVGTTEVAGLQSITVTIKQAKGRAAHPVSFSLSRWAVDPAFAQQMAQQEADMKQAFADAQAAATSAE